LISQSRGLGDVYKRQRQILMKAMRRFRTHQKALTGQNMWEMDFRDMTYNWWKHENRT
jgi:hypothetical protein